MVFLAHESAREEGQAPQSLPQAPLRCCSGRVYPDELPSNTSVWFLQKENQYLIPESVDLECVRYCIVYDSNTSSLELEVDDDDDDDDKNTGNDTPRKFFFLTNVKHTLYLFGPIELLPGPAVEFGQILTHITRQPVYVLRGGTECFSGLYHFFRTQKIIWMPQIVYSNISVCGQVQTGAIKEEDISMETCSCTVMLWVILVYTQASDSSCDADKLLHIKIEDSSDSNLLNSFRHICHFMELHLQLESVILVFSTRGISRSSAAVVAFLMHYNEETLKEKHRLYRLKLEELTKLQDNCTNSITRQKKRLQELALVLKRCRPSLSCESAEAAQDLENQMKERQGLFFDMEAYLPKKNGLYLSLVLGNVNVTLLSKQAKFAYKDEYEKFKLYHLIILIVISFSCRFLLNSRIKGWWVFHHYVSTFLSGVMLTWPDGLMYQKFRNQFLSFSMYQSFVQFLQYYYQSGCLYRLRALGERHTMDLTVEGFQSWMWRGLTFLLPFLFFGHVLMCGFPFLLLFLGNFFTTLRVVHQKFHSQQQGSKKD
ncbi:Transmembrane protein 120A [Cricetulus griseus]|uniref:Transmembrane protein 120A n=1 Tax=Cricetulus griseus TaxID=10029 RepID=G3HA22_CRIGR|nr:Transmembrane protein 120A [Cricetulus griseus]